MLRDRGDSRTEMKPHTVLFMDRAHHLSDRRAHNTLHRIGTGVPGSRAMGGTGIIRL